MVCQGLSFWKSPPLSEALMNRSLQNQSERKKSIYPLFSIRMATSHINKIAKIDFVSFSNILEVINLGRKTV
jgi:hypothetical protein